MTTVGICLPDQFARPLVADFAATEHRLMRVVPSALVDEQLLAQLDVLVVTADPQLLTPAVLTACDRAAVRIVPVTGDEPSVRLAASLGLPAATALTARGVLGAAEASTQVARTRTAARVIAIWGPHGAPGRTMLSLSLAQELGRGGAGVCLIDADSHAPSVAQSLGLSDDSPGLAGACRQVMRGRFDQAEFVRIARPWQDGTPGLTTLTGINRPSRWPELRGDAVSQVVRSVRGWTDHVVIDTAASLEQDEELMSDVSDGPRRNAATLATLSSADHIVAVASADPVGMTRFVRAIGDVSAIAPGAIVTVVANRVRSGSIGFDAKSQIRRTLEELAGIASVRFLPDDRAAHDRAVLMARPVAQVAPRSPYVAGVRRLAAELVSGGATESVRGA